MGNQSKFIYMACLAITINGCASYTPSINAATAISPDDAYIYGRLFLDSEEQWNLGRRDIGFVMKCDDGNTYNFPFDRTQKAIFVAKIKPSRCSITDVLKTGISVPETNPYSYDKLQSIDIRAGNAYYIGDHVMHSKRFMSAWQQFTTTWFMEKPSDQFDKTTSDMQTEYPNMSVFPYVDLLNPSRSN